jgi:hypothetical protein
MKKGIIVLLIAVLVSGFAFADLKGTATFSAGYDLDGKKFTLDNAKTGSATFKFEFEAQSGATAEAESGIYAEFSGSLSATIEDGTFKTKLDLKDALIKSTDGLWSVNLTKVAHGIEFTYADYALDVFYASKLNWGASIATPKYEVMEGLTISANAGYKQDKKDVSTVDAYKLGFDKDTQKIVDEKYAEYVKTHDDGVYYTASLEKAQKDVYDAEKALATAEENFAKKQNEDNYKAVETAKKNLKTAEDTLAKAVKAIEQSFLKANDGAPWVKTTTTWTYKESWETWFDDDPDPEDYPGTDKYVQVNPAPGGKYVVPAGGDNPKDYYIVETGYGHYALKTPVGGLDPYVAGDKVVFTVTQAKDKATYVALFRGYVDSKSYAYNKNLYVLSTPDYGTQSVYGGVTIAYAADKLTASLALNGEYEMLTYKKFAFDVTAKAAYDFVNGEVSFARTLKEENVLGAKASAKLDDVIGMPLSVEVACSDILDKTEAGRILSGKASFEVAGIKLGAGATMKFANDYHKTAVGRIAVNGSIEYAFEFATIKAEAKGYKEYFLDKDFAGDYKEAKIAVDPSITVTNTSLIQNATLSLAWAGAHFGGDAEKKALGTITASVGIKF